MVWVDLGVESVWIVWIRAMISIDFWHFLSFVHMFHHVSSKWSILAIRIRGLCYQPQVGQQIQHLCRFLTLLKTLVEICWTHCWTHCEICINSSEVTVHICTHCTGLVHSYHWLIIFWCVGAWDVRGPSVTPQNPLRSLSPPQQAEPAEPAEQAAFASGWPHRQTKLRKCLARVPKGSKRFQKLRDVQSKPKQRCVTHEYLFECPNINMSEYSICFKRTHSAFLSISQRIFAHLSAFGTCQPTSNHINPPWQRPLPTHWSW